MNIKKLEQLQINKTYTVAKHDFPFCDLYLTPIVIDLQNRKLVYENAARDRKTIRFTDKSQENQFFNLMNIWS